MHVLFDICLFYSLAAAILKAPIFRFQSEFTNKFKPLFMKELCVKYCTNGDASDYIQIECSFSYFDKEFERFEVMTR